MTTTPTHFKPNDNAPEQEISDHHLIDQMDPCYEMFNDIQGTDDQGMQAIKNLSAYLRNEQGQRRWNKKKEKRDQVVPFVITREYQPGGVVIYHFYVAGVRQLAAHWVKADGSAISRRQSAQGA
jgi:hypothetical protein